MELKQVTIKNFKGIVEQTLQFKPGFNLIIGENGIGKTSILEATAVGLGGFLDGFQGLTGRGFSSRDARLVYTKLGDGSFDSRSIMPMSVTCEAEVEGEYYTWEARKTSLKSSRTRVQPRNICKAALRLQEKEDGVLPLVRFRQGDRSFDESVQSSNKRQLFPRIRAYVDSVGKADIMDDLFSWSAKMEFLAWQSDSPIAEYEAVKQAVSSFMARMNTNSIDQNQVFYEKQSDEVVYEQGGKVIPLANLSSGYQSLIGLVYDTAYRMAVLNPQLLGKITDTPGVLLIDELDVNLHPSWQWKVIPALIATFPNLQIIATTHSPILVASAPNINIIDISGEEADSFPSEYGLDISDTLVEVQKSQSLPSELQAQIKSFYEMIEIEDLEKAKACIKRLETEWGENIPEVLKARITYDLESTPLED